MSKDTRDPGYYAIIPAPVRYAQHYKDGGKTRKVPQGAKLLYGEITALCNKKGYCWALNEYFTELYEVDERTIRRWIHALEKLGVIDILLIPTDEGTVRHIYLSDKPIEGPWVLPEEETEAKPQSHRTKMSAPPGGQKCPVGGDKNVRHNNTVFNTTKDPVDAEASTWTPLTEKQAEEAARRNLIGLFAMEYQKLYDQKLTLTGKELGSIKAILKTLKTYPEQDRANVLAQKRTLLAAIAARRNKYQNWRYLPSQLVAHWNDLVPGCILEDAKPALKQSTRPPIVKAPEDYA